MAAADRHPTGPPRRGKPPPVARLTHVKKLIPFGWYGGKFSHLAWLLPRLPACRHYCEPFAGSAAILLNRPPSPVETYNDLDGEVVNFFRVLRDEPEALTRAIGLTPFAREEFALACTLDPALPPLERARRFYVRARQVRTGLNQTATLGRWANCKNTSRAGMSGVISRWLGGVEMLPQIAERLLRVQIENRPALDVIRLYDAPGTLFYCLHPSTPIRLENERVVPVSDIQVGDRVAPGRTVQATYTRAAEGSLLRIQVQGLPDPLEVTPEHRLPRIPGHTGRQERRSDAQLWAARETVAASYLRVGDYLLIPSGGLEVAPAWGWCDEAAYRGVRKPGLCFTPGPELYRLLGYYAAEGHIQRQGGRSVGVLLSFAAHEATTWVADARACFSTTFNLHAATQPGPAAETVLQVCAWSTSVAEFFSRQVLGTAKDHNKALSSELLKAPIAMQRQILVGWLRGGGLETKSRNRVRLLGTSASEQLARQMFTLAVRCGLRPSFKARAGRTFDVYFAAEDAASLGFRVPCRRYWSTRRVVNRHTLARIRSVIARPYSGTVIDLDVDGDDCFAAPYVLTHNCDPPYLHATRGDARAYRYEMTDAEHRELADVLNAAQGKVALSNYECQLLDRLYPPPRWHKHTSRPRTNHATKGKRVEVLWTNYELKPAHPG